MKLLLGYEDKRGAHTTILISPIDVEAKLKYLAKRGFSAALWDQDNRAVELGGVYKHEEVGWSWYFDNDILKSDEGN